ncbi:hypothetical protein DSL72_007195 [Monilinia vaccinii-corymbosi]|uniref:Uncharacterized protein n=1 Tax=Monilinia vaccinii-corymbosi TaxID=61207 RepID=A0A8A3PMD5_9HELO|nr:hypothetical protein DSL72_007195 [Monilinia vaccinii-corymbosi]
MSSSVFSFSALDLDPQWMISTSGWVPSGAEEGSEHARKTGQGLSQKPVASESFSARSLIKVESYLLDGWNENDLDHTYLWACASEATLQSIIVALGTKKNRDSQD